MVREREVEATNYLSVEARWKKSYINILLLCFNIFLLLLYLWSGFESGYACVV
jgi:hypothetical protein